MYQYTINIDGFTFDGISYAAAQLTVDTATYVGNGAQQYYQPMLAPVTYDGTTFDSIGIGMTEYAGPTVIGASLTLPGQDLNSHQLPPGSITALITPEFSAHQWNGFAVSGLFTVELANACRTCPIGIAQTHGTLTGIDPPAPTQVPEPGTLMLVIFGLALMRLMQRDPRNHQR